MNTFNFTTVTKSVLGDLNTPVSIYLKVRDIFPESVLLESSDFHGNENSLSYIALKPLASFGVNSYTSEMKYPDGKREEEKITDSFTVADSMNKFLSRFRITGYLRTVRLHFFRCREILRTGSRHGVSR